jgi:hypothetical protein
MENSTAKYEYNGLDSLGHTISEAGSMLAIYLFAECQYTR